MKSSPSEIKDKIQEKEEADAMFDGPWSNPWCFGPIIKASWVLLTLGPITITLIPRQNNTYYVIKIFGIDKKILVLGLLPCTSLPSFVH